MGVTISDVAKKAKVSPMTVSRALRSHPSVHPHLRKAVLQAAKSLNYKPNPIAQAMVNKSLGLVAISVCDLDNPHFGKLAQCLSQRLQDAGLKSVFCDRVKEVIEFKDSFFASGSILFVPSPDDVNCLAQGQAVVSINAQAFSKQHAPDVSVDFAPAYVELTRRALALGRTKMGFVAPEGELHCWRTKFGHVTAILDEAGLKPVILPPESVQSPASVAQFLLAHPNLVDTLFCINDMIAARVYLELLRRGLRVPEGILLVGCDGTFVMEGVWTVIVDVEEIASKAVDCLVRQLKGENAKDPAEQVLVPAQPLSFPGPTA